MRKSIVAIVFFAALIAQAQDVRIPFTMNECNLPMAKVTVSDQTAFLVLDTGASFTRLDSQFRPLQSDGNISIIFENKYRATVRASFDSYKELRELCGAGDGIIGQDVLSAYQSITFDYAEKVLILRRE